MMLRSARPFRALGLLMGVCASGVLFSSCSGPAPTSPTRSAQEDAAPRLFLVQLRLTDDKSQAARTLGRAERWWHNRPPTDRPPLVQAASSARRPVTIAWSAPFYRVRLGPFATRTQARAVLNAARSAFPEAFIAPDRMEAPDPKR